MAQRRGLELNATQLIASGLATTTAAVIASYIGVAGTIIGAGLMSIVTTVGAAIYQHYLDRGKVRYTTLVVSREDRAAEPRTGPRTEPAAEPDTRPESETETPLVEERPRRRVRWYAVAGAAVAIFAVVMGGITLVEAMTNKPISAMVGGSDRAGTSLGHTFGDTGSEPTDEPITPAPSPSVSGEPDVPTASPSGGATTQPPVPSPPDNPPATTVPPTPAPSPSTTIDRPGPGASP